MMSAAALSLSAPYAFFGIAATYTPPGGGTPVPCTVIRDNADRDVNLGGISTSQVFAEGDTIEVRASEVVPAKGGKFTIATVDHLILADPKSADPDRLVWTCSVT